MRGTRNQKPLPQAMGQIVKKMTEIIKADRLRECVRVRLEDIGLASPILALAYSTGSTG